MLHDDDDDQVAVDDVDVYVLQDKDTFDYAGEKCKLELNIQADSDQSINKVRHYFKRKFLRKIKYYWLFTTFIE